MPRVLIAATVGLLAIEALAILAGGVAGGGWLWGLIFAAVAVGATIEWVRLRASSKSPRAVADRMIGYTMMALLGLALPALKMLESRW